MTRPSQWGAVAVALAFAAGSTASLAQTKVSWRMQSAFGSQLTHLGPSGQRFVKDIEEMTDGNFIIKFHEPGTLVPSLECFDAASKGSVDACWTTPGFHAGKYPVLPFFTTVPFGPSYGEFFAWKIFGNGNKLRQEIYDKHGLIAIDAFAIGPETSGWFRKEIKSLEQLKGMKMRFFGLGAKVMQKLGVSTQLLAPADIFPALERGVIDAAEFSMPTMDIKQGFYQVAKYNYFPGWHQWVSVGELLMNKKTFDALPKSYKKFIQMAAGYQVHYTYAETEAMQFDAMVEMQTKHKVQLRRWKDSDLAAFEKAWLEVIQEESAKDALFKKVADDYLAFRKSYATWGEAQAFKATYLATKSGMTVSPAAEAAAKKNK
ncbi:MAG TPA: TRAP transporter substrate-binding protein [Burkholderiales bacterium]|jgi:TRAP-type mannitol/chloroaromatic compound transport system substrate-binding protein